MTRASSNQMMIPASRMHLAVRCIRARSSSGNPRPKTLSGPDRQAGREDGFAEQLGGDAEFAEKASKHFGGAITEARRLRMPVAEGGGDDEDDEDDDAADGGVD